MKYYCTKDKTLCENRKDDGECMFQCFRLSHYRSHYKCSFAKTKLEMALRKLQKVN